MKNTTKLNLHKKGFVKQFFGWFTNRLYTVLGNKLQKKAYFFLIFFFCFLVLSSCSSLLDKNFSKITPAQIENGIKNEDSLQLQDKEGNTVLHLAARNSTDPAVIEVLLEAGADIYARNKNSWTPLHEATRYNPNPKIITTLLRTNIDINIHTQNWLYTSAFSC